MARKFLYVVAAIILLAIAAGVLYRIFEKETLEWALVPSAPFENYAAPAAPDYSDDANWAALPDKDDPSDLLPAGDHWRKGEDVDIFFIHPTTFMQRSAWNAGAHDKAASAMVDALVLTGQASAFNSAGPVYAPYYRQATLGAFFDRTGSGAKALGLAYQDVLKAFDYYIAHENKGRPFILAGHSQGALHGLMLLRDRIAGTVLAKHMVAAYLIGWPVSVAADVKAVGLAPCAAPEDTGCVISWQSFAPDGDPADLIAAYNALPGLTGEDRAGAQMLCVNPVSWRMDLKDAPAADNPGALPPPAVNQNLGQAKPGMFGARCGGDGVLYLDRTPEGPFNRMVFPGKNFHVYDIHLFYAGLRENVRRRADAFLGRN